MPRREAGVLLHPTSLPGRFGIGDLGPAADAFLDWVVSAGLGLWQVMPLGPTGYWNSPYNTLSAFAGNTLLISPEQLVADGLLPAAALDDAPPFPEDHVDFGPVISWKRNLLWASWTHALATRPTLRDDLHTFEEDPAQRHWLSDWTLFASLLGRNRSLSWTEWPREIVERQPAALEAARRELAPEISFRAYRQWIFFSQWDRVRREAGRRGIRIVGDLPIYAAIGSADVWANRRYFTVGEDGRPEAVAGVPPDYFSETGQLWGNPLYRWDVLAADGYQWWIDRLRQNFRLADIVRIDHFRGLSAYWEVKAGETTAIHGRWVKGPGTALFAALRRALGERPVIAEDLGSIDDDVKALLAATGFPGMRVLQFAFGDEDSLYLPHHHTPNSVVYTGTHDNDTTRGWWQALDEKIRDKVRDYLGTDGREIAWDLIRAAFTSVAERAIVPMQDLAGLGSEARMNVPGRAEGNWSWRARREHFSEASAARLRRLATLTARLTRPGQTA
ncbi:MAG: 4-alpha-glucanotransferase [Thermoanaerobaculia bacterium]